MLEIGDKIVHLRYGAGTVAGKQVLQRQGKSRCHYRIELADESGTLLIPEDAVDNAELRQAERDTERIARVLQSPPAELNDNHRTRQGQIEKLLGGGDPDSIARVLRDLTWRERTCKLTGTDKRLRKNAFERLVEEVALGASQNPETIQLLIDRLINDAMEQHLAAS